MAEQQTAKLPEVAVNPILSKRLSFSLFRKFYVIKDSLERARVRQLWRSTEIGRSFLSSFSSFSIKLSSSKLISPPNPVEINLKIWKIRLEIISVFDFPIQSEVCQISVKTVFLPDLNASLVHSAFCPLLTLPVESADFDSHMFHFSIASKLWWINICIIRPTVNPNPTHMFHLPGSPTAMNVFPVESGLGNLTYLSLFNGKQATMDQHLQRYLKLLQTCMLLSRFHFSSYEQTSDKKVQIKHPRM